MLTKRSKIKKPLFVFKSGNYYYGVINCFGPLDLSTRDFTKCLVYYESELDYVSDFLCQNNIKFDIIEYEKAVEIYDEQIRKAVAQRITINKLNEENESNESDEIDA